MDNYILKIENLSKTFTRNILNKGGIAENERYHIIDNLSLDVAQGKVTALIGGNGAGKTTLFNIISRFTEADTGSIMFQHGVWVNLLNYPAHKLKPLGIGRLFQDNHIFLNMTVMDNMLIAADDEWGEKPFLSLLRSQANQEHEKHRLIKAEIIFAELFGRENAFGGKRDDPASTLSYGQQRLLGLARLFMGKDKLVLLDEPTSGVNPEVVNVICRVIKILQKEKGVSIFLIEHNMKVVEAIADYCNFMSHGLITAFGFPDDVIGNEQVRNNYLGM